jgi:hypothetical protein
MIPLPEPVKLRREIRRDGGYNMVPAYTAEQLHAYAAACVAEERERCARVCESTTWSEDIDIWREMTKRDVSARSMLECAAAIRAGGV